MKSSDQKYRDDAVGAKPSLPSHMMMCRESLFDRLVRLEKLANELCGHQPATSTALPPAEPIPDTFFSIVEHCADSMNGAAARIDEVCSRIELRLGVL
jgi:hypothetical protein